MLFPEPYNPKAVAVAARHDMIMPSNVSVQVVNDDFGIDTLVLTMNSSMKQKIYDTFNKAINVFTLSELAVRVMLKYQTHMARVWKSITNVLNSSTAMLKK